MIIHELKTIQEEHGYLPAEALQALSRRLNVPLYRLHGVASFYPHFRLQPPPAADVKVCNDMACFLRGATDVHDIVRTVADALALLIYRLGPHRASDSAMGPQPLRLTISIIPRSMRSGSRAGYKPSPAGVPRDANAFLLPRVPLRVIPMRRHRPIPPCGACSSRATLRRC